MPHATVPTAPPSSIISPPTMRLVPPSAVTIRPPVHRTRNQSGGSVRTATVATIWSKRASSQGSLAVASTVSTVGATPARARRSRATYTR